jgi:hypothetical protein
MGRNGSTCSWAIAWQHIYDTCWKTSLEQNKILILQTQLLKHDGKPVVE